jgi:hypothetical protein
MASFYLSSDRARQSGARDATERVLAAMGALALPTLSVLRARRIVSVLRRRGRRRAAAS